MTLSATALAAISAAAATASAVGLSGGTLELLDAGGSVLASASLGVPTAAGAVVTMSGYPRTVIATGGTIASARYRTSAAADWKTGMSVGLPGSGAQVIVSSLTVTGGQPVTIASATLTHAAS